MRPLVVYLRSSVILVGNKKSIVCVNYIER